MHVNLFAVALHWQISGTAAVEIEVKHKLSEDQCSGSIFSDTVSIESAQLAATKRKLSASQQQQQQHQLNEV